MGKLLSTQQNKDYVKKDVTSNKPRVMKFVLHGLAGAGKTSMLMRLKNGEMLLDNISTIGIDFQVFNIDGIKYQGWDTASRERSRTILQSYLRGASGFIYVVDSADGSDLDNSLSVLNEDLLQREMAQQTVVMVVANKQDLDNAISPEELEEKITQQCTLGLGISVFVMPCSVLTGEGLQTAFDMFISLMHKKRNGELPSGLITRAWETMTMAVDVNNVEGCENDSGEKNEMNGIIPGDENVKENDKVEPLSFTVHDDKVNLKLHDEKEEEKNVGGTIKVKKGDGDVVLLDSEDNRNKEEDSIFGITNTKEEIKINDWNTSTEIKNRMGGFVN